MVRRIGRTEIWTARRIEGASPVGSLVLPFVQRTASIVAEVAPATASRLSETCLSLVTAALGERLGAIAEGATSARTALIFRAKAIIESNLHDHALNTERVAEAVGISPRYLQDLFHAEGTTVSDWIWKRRSIHERPKTVDARTEGGHWEGDLIICKRTRPVLVLHERKSRVTLAARLAGKTAAETISVMLAVFARVEPALRKSITFDNDTAFAQHALLRTMRTMTTWFCDAYASWQKGGVENANGRLRTLVAPSDRHRQSVRRGNPGHRHHRQSHAQKMPGLQDPFSGNPQRAWQRRANPVHIKLCCIWL